jgi:hypothetical protein
MGSFPVGTYQFSVAVGDFNGDGKPDLLFSGYIGNSTSGVATVLLGDGTGLFTAEPGILVEGQATFVAVGDFNGDGKTDLAVAFYPNQVAVFLGTGLGGFTQAVGSPVTVGNFTRTIAVADFNGDGAADLAVANDYDGTVTVLLGNGKGGFTEAGGSPLAVGNGAYSIAVGDFNQDGNADLAIADENDNYVTVLLGNGLGGFTQAAGSPIPVGNDPVSIVVADFDLDGNFDLAIANSGDDNVTVLLGKGNGGFRTGIPIQVVGSPLSAAVGDFNGDGIADLAVVSDIDVSQFGVGASTVTVLLGTGTGLFTEAGGSPFPVGNGADSIVVGDFNQDGKADLAIADLNDYNVTVLLGSAKVQTITFGTLSDRTFGSAPFTIGATASSNLPVGFASNTPAVCTVSLATVTLVEAGICTITASQPGDATYGAAIPVLQSFTVSAASQTIAFPPLGNVILPAGPITLSATASSGLTVTFASSALSVCTVSGNTATILAVGTCAIQATQAGNTDYLQATPVMRSFTVAPAFSKCDVNQDMVTNAADARLMIQQALGINPATDDLTGSGTVDLVDVQIVINAVLQLGCEAEAQTQVEPEIRFPVTTTLTLAPSANPSVFGAQVMLTATVTPSAAVGQVTFYNGTSILGYATLSEGRATLSTILLPPDVSALHAYYGGAFTVGPPMRYDPSTSNTVKQTVSVTPASGFSSQSYQTPAYAEPEYLAVADFNGDGKADLLFSGGYTGGYMTLLLGDGTGGFTDANTFLVGTQALFVAVADFNADGKPDFAVVDATDGTVIVWLGLSGGFTLAPGSPNQVGRFPTSIGVGDFNQDEIVDLAVTNSYDGTVTILLGDGTGGFAPAAGSPITVGMNPFSVAVEDFNQDGIADLAVVNKGDGTVTILLGNGSGGFSPAPGSPIRVEGSQPQSIAVADLDGDGKFDLAIANGYDTTVTVLLGNGSGGFSQGPGSPFQAGIEPSSVAVADFNGDGKPDLVVENNDNTVRVLLGTGTGAFMLSGGSPFPAGSGPNSLVVGDFNSDGRVDVVVADNSGGTLTLLFGASLAQTITFGALSDQTFGAAPFIVAATATSGLVVAFTSNTPAVCLVSGATVTLAAAGKCTIIASQSGNQTYQAATSVMQSFTVNEEPQTIAFSALSNVTLPAAPVALIATASSGLPVTLASTAQSVCTVSGKTATIAAIGTCAIQATQPGDTNYLPANPVTRTFSVLSAFSKCDINQDMNTNVTDAQLMMKEALGLLAPVNDLEANGRVNVLDVQVVIDAALGRGCTVDSGQ